MSEVPSESAGGQTPVCLRRGACCKHSPGWFAPGEAERAADHLGIDVGDFAQRYLIIDNTMVGELRVEVFAPVKVDEQGEALEGPNARISRVYHFMTGACVFYDEPDKACRIHEARPIECRHYFCRQPQERNLGKEAIARMWLEARPEE